MYKIIELKDYDVLLPFVCRKCGSCCRDFALQIPAEDLPQIAQLIGKPIEAIRKLHEDAYDKKFTDSPINCIFLNNENRCSIYSMRPKPCRLYPLDTDFGAAGINCEGYKEFNKIVEALFIRRRYAALRDPSNYKGDVRYIPKSKWPTICRIIKKTEPSETTFQRIMDINKVEK